jgi:hypothetical protein
MEVSRRRGKLNPPNRAIDLHEMALPLQHAWLFVIVFTQHRHRYTSIYAFETHGPSQFY